MIGQAALCIGIALVTFGLVGGAGAAAAHRFLHHRDRTTLIGFGLAALGTTSIVVFTGMWIAAWLGVTLAAAILAGALAVLVVTRTWTFWRPIVTGAATVLAIALLDLGMLCLRSVSTDPFLQAARRFYPWELPGDNELPSLLASWVVQPGAGRFLVGDWLPSDRPPLQAGLVLLTRILGWAPRVVSWTNIDTRMLDFGASVASQLVWVPAAAALLWALGFKRVVVLASLFFTAAVPVMFVNTVYTWPKLLAAGMMVGALSVLVPAIRGRIPVATGSVLSAALSVLGVLAHGGGAFVLPAVAVLWLVLIIRSSQRWRAVFAALGVAGVLYLPWALFQRLAYPPGDRLLKWHLAGVIPIDSRSFPRALVDSYSKLGWGAWLEGRGVNLARAFDPGVLADLDFWNPAARTARQTLEFSATPPALAVGALILCAFLIAAVVGILRRRFDAQLRWSVIVVLSMIGCILIWAIVMFLPGAAIVHQGSHTWIVVLLCVPFAWLTSRSRILATAAVILQVAWTVVLYGSAPLSPASRLDRVALLLLVISAVLAVGAMMFRVRRPLMSQQPPVAMT